MTRPCLLLLIILGIANLPGHANDGIHEGRYQKNLVLEGPGTGDKITYTLYLPPGFQKERGPYPLIVFLHGAGGGNASSQVLQSYEVAREAGHIGDAIIVFPEKYGGTVWRDGAKGKRPETNILRELLPYLEETYHATRDREQRTVMGFSMGAAGSLYWGGKHLDLFSTAVALDAGGGSSVTDASTRNYVPQYAEKSAAIRGSLKLRLVQGGLKTRSFRETLDELKIPYDFEALPAEFSDYPEGSACLSRKDPTKKFLHNPACMTEGVWGQNTWSFIGKNTP